MSCIQPYRQSTKALVKTLNLMERDEIIQKLVDEYLNHLYQKEVLYQYFEMAFQAGYELGGKNEST